MDCHVFICDECRAVVDVRLSNSNAVKRVFCVGREPVGADPLKPVKGDHEPREMRMIGSTPL